MHKLISGLFAVLLFATLAACSSSGSDDAADKSTTTAAKSTTTATSTTTTSDVPEDTSTTTTDSGGSASEQDYIDGLTEGLSSGSEEDDDLVLTEDEATCVAEEWVPIMGTDALASDDVTPDDLADPSFDFVDLGLDEGQAQDMVDAFDACDVDIRTKLIDSISADLDATQRACVDEGLSDDLLNQVLVEALSSAEISEELGRQIGEVQSTCGTN